MLVRLKAPEPPPEPKIPLPKLMTGLQPVTVSVNQSTISKEPADVDEQQFIQRDADRRRLGRLAQDIAKKSEQKRFAVLGHPNPDQAVEPV